MKIKRWHIGATLILGGMLGFSLQEFLLSSSHFIPVVVAGTDISAGTVLRPEKLQVIQWPREYLPTNTAKTINQVAGKVMTQPAVKGEPVLLPKLAEPVMREVT